MTVTRAAVLAASLALACAGCDRNANAQAGKGLPSASGLPSARAPQPAALPTLRPGDQRTYAVELSSEARVDQNVLTQFDLKAQLLVTVVQVTPERAVVRASFQNAKLGTALSPLQAEFAKLEPDLATPFAFEIERGGVIRSVSFADRPSGLVFGIRRSVVAALQAPPRPLQASSLTEEFDATGRYQAEYRPTNEPGRFAKRKLRYLSFASAGAVQGADMARLMPMIDKTESDVRIGTTGVVEAVSSLEQQRAGSGQMAPIVSTTRLELTTTSSGRAPPSALPDARAWLAGMQAYDAERPAFPLRESPEFDKVRIAGRNLDQVLTDLRKLQRVPEPTRKPEQEAHQQRYRDSYAALEAMIRTQATALPAVVRLIRQGDELAVVLLDALGSSGAPEAHEALVGLIESGRLDAVKRKVAAIALSRTSKPSPASIEGLKALLSTPSLRVQALLGLGTTCRRLGESGDEPRALALLEVILERLRAATDSTEQVTALRAIANSGMARAYASVEPLLSAKDDDVRGAAVEALQLMEHPKVDAALTRAVTEDAAPSVKLAATRAARLRKSTESLERALLRAARSDANPHVRLGALRVLVAWLPQRPSLRASIADMATQETQEAIRAEAKSALQGGSLSRAALRSSD